MAASSCHKASVPTQTKQTNGRVLRKENQCIQPTVRAHLPRRCFQVRTAPFLQGLITTDVYHCGVRSCVRPVDERRKDWNEDREALTLETAIAQAQRCLDCDVPGCVSACPLNNRIPEWLDALRKGEVERAASISHSTSNLPEICGTVCPSHRLCEGGCTLNAKDGPVTIGALERFITDEAINPRTTEKAGSMRKSPPTCHKCILKRTAFRVSTPLQPAAPNPIMQPGATTNHPDQCRQRTQLSALTACSTPCKPPQRRPTSTTHFMLSP